MVEQQVLKATSRTRTILRREQQLARKPTVSTALVTTSTSTSTSTATATTATATATVPNSDSTSTSKDVESRLEELQKMVQEMRDALGSHLKSVGRGPVVHPGVPSAAPGTMMMRTALPPPPPPPMPLKKNAPKTLEEAIKANPAYAKYAKMLGFGE